MYYVYITKGNGSFITNGHLTINGNVHNLMFSNGDSVVIKVNKCLKDSVTVISNKGVSYKVRLYRVVNSSIQ